MHVCVCVEIHRSIEPQPQPQHWRNYMKYQTKSRPHIKRQTDLKLARRLLLWQITDSNKLCSGQLLCAISFYYISRFFSLSICVCIFIFIMFHFV